MSISLRESVARISDPRYLDESVEEVFGAMLGWSCERAEKPGEAASSSSGHEPDTETGRQCVSGNCSRSTSGSDGAGKPGAGSSPSHVPSSVSRVVSSPVSRLVSGPVSRLVSGLVSSLVSGPRSGTAPNPCSVTAVVGFGGVLSGACIFEAEIESAQKMASRLTGAEFAASKDSSAGAKGTTGTTGDTNPGAAASLILEAVVEDAVGELCNMLAGCWKSKIPELAADCGLSVPAVITGGDYKVRVQSPEFELRHAYSAGGASFAVTILCDGIR